LDELCACGCGEPLDPVKHPHLRKRGKGFKPGHWSRVHPRPARTPDPSEIPSGICECGCGKKTAPCTQTNRKRRHFKGYPAPYCHGHGRRAHGPEHHLFKGIRRTNGYVYEYAPDHPAATIGEDMKGFVLQHRLVWERSNGRLLRDNEVVHHINGVRDDNRPENLVAMTNAAHMSGHKKGCHLSDEHRRKVSDGLRTAWHEGRRQPRAD